MEAFRLVRHHVHLEDYPSYADFPVAITHPGILLAEHYAFQGVRYAVNAGYAACFVYFYLFYRPRLPFADRPLARLHHMLFPTAAYTTPLGIAGGLAYGAVQQSTAVQEGAVAASLQQEVKAADVSLAGYERRRASARLRYWSGLPWWTRAAVHCHLVTDPTEAQLVARGFPPKSLEDMLMTNSLSWVAARSGQHDSLCWYRDAVIDAAFSTPGAPAAPVFSKLQSDYLVSQCLQILTDPTASRWLYTAGRCSFLGMVTFSLAWRSGHVISRIGMGLGAGVSAASVFSALQLDNFSAFL